MVKRYMRWDGDSVNTECEMVRASDYDALAADKADDVRRMADDANKLHAAYSRIRELEAALRDAQNRLLQVTEPWLGARAAIIPAAVAAIVPLLNEWQSLLRSPPSEEVEHNHDEKA